MSTLAISTPSNATTHEILEATAFVTLMSVDMLRGPKREKRFGYARKLFVATARAEDKTRSMMTRVLRRDRTTVRYHEIWVQSRTGQEKSALEIDVSRVQMELRRRQKSVCAKSSTQHRGTSHDI